MIIIDWVQTLLRTMMPPRALRCVIVAVGFCHTVAMAGTDDPAADLAPVSPFREFAGTCQGGPNIPHLYDLVGWDRADLYWSKLEPKPGQWNQQELQKWGDRVLEMQSKGVKLLPILCYNTSWSWDRAEHTYDYGGERVHVKPLDNGEFLVEKFRRVKGAWTLQSSKEERPNDHWPLAAENEAAWQGYVRHTVEFLRHPPYNIKYFQVWNEAYPTSDFWGHGDVDTYMQRVHLPAARIIHELGGKVVYGGWPCCGSIQDYVAALDRNQAWKSIDVLDIHYFPLAAFEYLNHAARKRGYDSIGLWQTEIGFSQDPEFIGNSYPRFFSWCLSHNWSYPDRYRLFLFCASAPNDPKAFAYGRALVQGGKLSAHGLSLRTLNEVFNASKIENYFQVQTVPPLKSEINENCSSLEAFKVGGKKIVVAVHLVQNNDAKIFTDWNGDLDTMHLDFDHPTIEIELPEIKPEAVVSAQRVDMAGQRQSLEIQSRTSGNIKFQVPIRDAANSPAHTWFNHSNVVTFLVEITLK